MNPLVRKISTIIYRSDLAFTKIVVSRRCDVIVAAITELRNGIAPEPNAIYALPT
jgi:hypothetical protein